MKKTRVDIYDLRMLMDTEVPDESIQIFIRSANTLVNTRLSGKGLDEELLKEIEMWLSAHFVAAARDRITTSETIGPASETYANVFSEGLKSTPYGQTAINLDPTGELSKLGSKDIVLKAISETYRKLI